MSLASILASADADRMINKDRSYRDTMDPVMETLAVTARYLPDGGSDGEIVTNVTRQLTILYGLLEATGKYSEAQLAIILGS